MNDHLAGRRGKRDLLLAAQVIIKRSKPIEAIWATNFCTFMRESHTQTIWVVGLNNYKQLAHDKDTDRVLTPLKTDMKDVKQIAGGIHHTMVLTTDLKCSVVGRPEYGRLGLGSGITDVVSKLTPVTKLKDKIVYVGCGETCSYAIAENGKLFSWGSGSSSQLGVGDGDDEMEPVPVISKNTENKRMLLVSGGGQHAICLVEADEQEEKEPAKASSSNGKKDKSPPQEAGDKKAEKEKEKTTPPTAQSSDKSEKSEKSDKAEVADQPEKDKAPEKNDKAKKPAAKRGAKKK